jgi:hypothetical protein
MEALTNIDPGILLGSTNEQARLTALNQLALRGTRLSKSEVLPHVLACLTDADQEVRRAATNALREVTKDFQRSAAGASGRPQ